MDIVRTRAEARRAIAALRRAPSSRGGPARIGFVPTMGALHEGHLTLVGVARAKSDAVVMSIFVNPLQFGPREDFAAYPRTLDADAALAEARGVDLIFAPTVEEMYPSPPAVVVTPAPSAAARAALDSRWEGATRPGHFAGVLTVVAKLFHIVQPDIACFGQKDLQQVTLVAAMVRDLDMPIEVVVVPTVRDPDGLALSSRNAYLSAAERSLALVIPASLRTMVKEWRGGTVDAKTLLASARAVLDRSPGVTPDYVAIADPVSLEPVDTVTPGSVGMIAARVGRTRLIDNIRFEAQAS